MPKELMRVAVCLEIDPYHLQNKARLALCHEQCPAGRGYAQEVDYIRVSHWLGGQTVMVRCRACKRSEEFASGPERWGIESALLWVAGGGPNQGVGQVLLVKRELHLTALPGRPLDIVRMTPAPAVSKQRRLVRNYISSLMRRERHLRLVWNRAWQEGDTGSAS